MKKLAPIALAGLLALSACASSDPTSSSTATGTDAPAATGDRTYDVSGVQKVDEIAALLPEDVASAGVLNIGASTDYAPAEFLADDLTTAIGYDVDLGKAIGKVLGVETTVTNAQFASIIPAIGTKYDVGISSFTVTDERIASANMISYIVVGSAFAVAAGNPSNVNVDDLCGLTVGVQTGTWQNEEAETFAAECAEAGKDELTVLPYDKQSDVTTNLVGGKVDVMYADSTVVAYAVAVTEGSIEQAGEIRDSAPQGVVVAQSDPELTEAVQQALQHLMDDGTWKAIAENWGISDAVLTTAELNNPDA